MNLNDKFSTDIAKKIFGNIENVEIFLLKLREDKYLNNEIPTRIISRGKDKGKTIVDLNTKDMWKKVVELWNYSEGFEIIRCLFKETDKYKSGKESNETMKILIEEWEKLSLGLISWPFSQGDFDGFVQRLNAESIDGIKKDEKVKIAAVKYRRIKEINTVRNDFIETLIFEKNNNVLPTLNHRRGVDFFINGYSYDQKVAKSPTKEFKKKYGDKWKNKAISNPELVAEYLYKYQDEGRFGADSRLLVVYLDEEVSIDKIKKIIDDTDLNNPLEITFEYIHNKGKPTENIKNYKVNCFIILLYS